MRREGTYASRAIAGADLGLFELSLIEIALRVGVGGLIGLGK